MGTSPRNPGPTAFASQDQRYPELINQARYSIARVLDGDLARVSLVRCVGCVAISAHWSHWPCLFPQHGPGMKHLRSIVLADWQITIVAAYPRQLLRGLIHSDGCRVINRVWGGKYKYPRYLFTNTSTDILQIFRDACDAIGVEHRNNKPNTISVARRDSVASLDAFIRRQGLRGTVRLPPRRDGEIRQPREFQKLVGFGP